jgi:hypothetical protein
MEADAIEAVLRSLLATPWGWQAAIPGFTFLGRPVTLRIDTRSISADEPPPFPNPTEEDLARLVLGGLPGVLIDAERQYRTYHAEVPGAIELADDPHVWLSRSILARDGTSCWQFVVGIAGAEDYGTHTEFEAVSSLGVWSGD